MKAFLAAAMLMLAACSSTDRMLALGHACDSYAGTLDQLTPLKAGGKLSASTLAAVDTVNALTDPICRDPGKSAANIEGAITAVSSATAQLGAIQAGAH